MLAAQRKFGRLVVVEVHRGPFFRRVTSLAFSAVTPAMWVPEAVAINTGGTDPFPLLAGVTRGACDVPVLTSQWEFGLAVIEGFCRAPSLNAMASRAVRSQSSIMGFIGLVTADAIQRCVSHSLAGLVATVAACIRVGTLQCKIGEVVAERLGIQADNLGLPPLVIRVATSAFAMTDGWMAPMEPLMLSDISGDRLMAAEAET